MDTSYQEKAEQFTADFATDANTIGELNTLVSSDNCYRPRSGRKTRLFPTELLSQLGAIVTALIRYSFAHPRSPHLAPRFSSKYTVPRLNPAPF